MKNETKANTDKIAGADETDSGSGSAAVTCLLPVADLYHSCDPESLMRPPEGREGGPAQPASMAIGPMAIGPMAIGPMAIGPMAIGPMAIGQSRAVEAIRFGIGLRRKGFNIFVLGPPGAGRHTLVENLLRQAAAGQARPDDWCYINNFQEAHQPRLLRLPAGRAVELRAAMRRLVDDLRVALPAAFEREDYRTRRDALEQQMKARHEKPFEDLRQRAEKQDVALIRTPIGLTLAPLKNNEPIRPAEFQALPEAEQEAIRAKLEALQNELEAIVRKIPEWEREMRDALRELNQKTAAAAIGYPLNELKARYADLKSVLDYLEAVEHDIKEHAEDFLAAGHEAASSGETFTDIGSDGSPSFRRYQVNVIVDNSALSGAPVIYEDNPTHQNLVGRAEHVARMGTLLTDFNLLAPGALHRANGGYLILDAERVLVNGFAWESLKRTLRAGEIRIESIEQLLSLASTVSLKPEPVPLDVKVVLIGVPRIYYLLSLLDPEFAGLFKIAADFEDEVNRAPDEIGQYAAFIAGIATREKLRPFEIGATARIVEHAARLSGDAQKLSTDMRSLADLVMEADYLAGAAGEAEVTAGSVQAAIDARRRRADRLYRRFQEEVARKTIRIETSGAEIGQINGLSVVSIGGVAFGRPSRITARVQLGRGHVLDIERETTLGGPIHSKGVLILTAFLGARFGRKQPLALNASIVFEQSYGEVEGDSASSAELYALLSAIGEVPLSQSIAVTGSVDQRGQIQAIGGVNEKIEGFFDVCVARGLTGSEGVMIPASNKAHLMLRQDIVAAVKQGKFRIFAIETVDQGMEILTGLAAGAPDLAGNYPADSANGRVARRLVALAKTQRLWKQGNRLTQQTDTEE